MGLDRFLVWIQLSIASLSYEYPSGRSHSPEGSTEVTCARSNMCGGAGLCLPEAMTGSLISSLVMGQRSSSGMPEQSASFFSSCTFLRSLLRSPTDSADTHTHTRRNEKTCQERKEARQDLVCSHEHQNNPLSIKWNKLSWHMHFSAGIIKVVILAFSPFHSQMANVSVGEADHVCCQFCQFQSYFPSRHSNSFEF